MTLLRIPRRSANTLGVWRTAPSPTVPRSRASSSTTCSSASSATSRIDTQSDRASRSLPEHREAARPDPAARRRAARPRPRRGRGDRARLRLRDAPGGRRARHAHGRPDRPRRHEPRRARRPASSRRSGATTTAASSCCPATRAQVLVPGARTRSSPSAPGTTSSPPTARPSSAPTTRPAWRRSWPRPPGSSPTPTCRAPAPGSASPSTRRSATARTTSTSSASAPTSPTPSTASRWARSRTRPSRRSSSRSTFTGVGIHPGSAKGRLVNPVKLAARFIESLPPDTLSPETTEGREGFVHPYKIEGGAEGVTVTLILRDHDGEKLEEHYALATRLAEEAVAGVPGARGLVPPLGPVPQHARGARPRPARRRGGAGGDAAGRARAVARLDPRRHRRVAPDRDGAADPERLRRRQRLPLGPRVDQRPGHGDLRRHGRRAPQAPRGTAADRTRVHPPSVARGRALGRALRARGGGRHRPARVDLPRRARRAGLRRGDRRPDGAAGDARPPHELLLGPGLRRPAGGAAHGARVLVVRRQLGRAAARADPDQRRGGARPVAGRAAPVRRAGGRRRRCAPVGLAAVRALQADPPVRLLRERGPLLQPPAPARTARDRAARPRARGRVRARLRPRVLADRADRPDRGGRSSSGSSGAGRARSATPGSPSRPACSARCRGSPGTSPTTAHRSRSPTASSPTRTGCGSSSRRSCR